MKIKQVLQKLRKEWLKSTPKATQKLGWSSVFSSLLLHPGPEALGAEWIENGYDHMYGQERSGGFTENGMPGQKHSLNQPCSCTNSASIHELKVWARGLLERMKELSIRSAKKLASPGGSIQPRCDSTTGHSASQLGMAVLGWSS